MSETHTIVIDREIVQRANIEIGKSKQVIVCLEEISEFLQAYIAVRNIPITDVEELESDRKVLIYNLAEEIADVLICFDILSDIYPCTHFNFDVPCINNSNISHLKIILSALDMQKAISKVYRERVDTTHDMELWGNILLQNLFKVAEYYGITDECINSIIHEKQLRTVRRLNGEEF
jgi:hypothetical protein